ncbi:MAG: phosphate regulon sensor histidine kinase PhoR [Rhodocyclaceae bacterium]
MKPKSFWSDLLLGLALIALPAALLGGWLGAAAGWALAALGLLLLHVHHGRSFALLQGWLRRPDARTIPDARGAWGQVFVDIHRLLRQEAQARERIKAELDVFSQAAEASPDGLVILDADDRIVWCNRMAELHLGLRGERDAGLLVTNLVRLPRLADLIAQPRKGESLLYRPPELKGGVLSLEAIRFGKDRKLLISFDVTQIERVDAIRRDFVANVSHELRTPLTVISGFIEHMAEEPVTDAEEAQHQLGIMGEQVVRMLRLVNDLLILSRLEDETQVLREEEFDVRDLIYEVSGEARRLSAGRHSITCEVVPATLKGSRDELHSAFSNLVSNAVRYTPEGGRIVLRWRVKEGRGIYSVEDTGIGIPEEHIPRLTERFYRVDRGRSRESGGTGLGLSIVKHVLLRHQATLDIQSVPGAGSTFSAVFPSWRVTLPQD